MTVSTPCLPDSSERPPSLSWIVGLWLASRLWLTAVGALALAAWPRLPGYNDFHGNVLIDMWIKWDAGWYLTIAEKGYSYAPGQNGPCAWFPMFPMLIRLFDWFGDRAISGMLVTNLAFLGALVMLARLLAMDWPASTVRKALILLVLFPGSVFFSSLHSESTCLFMVVGSFLAARKGNWALAGLLGAGAALSRAVGVVVLPALIVEYLLQHDLPLRVASLRRVRPDILWLCLIPLGTLGFFSYLQWNVGNFWAYLDVYRLNNEELAPWRRLARGLPPTPHIWFGLPWGFLGVYLLVRGWKGMRPSYRAFALLGVAVPFGHAIFVAFYRYLLIVFPLVPAAANVLDDDRSFRIACALLLVAQALFMAWYAQGYEMIC